MFLGILFSSIVLSALCVNASVLPVGKCSLEDSVCLKDAFQKALPIFVSGIPEAGTDVLDPLDIEDFKFDLSGLKFSLNDGKLKGLKTLVFNDVKWNQKQKYFTIDFNFDGVVKGSYTASGQILILPITGDGLFKLKLKKMQMQLRFDYALEKNADGKDIVVLKKYSFVFDVKENAHFNLTNLFNGNKDLSDPMLIFLNQNWKEISQEFGRPMIDAAAKILFKNIHDFLVKEPIEEIANV